MEEGELFQNKYRLGKLLGEGAMGVVYAATQEPSGMPVAIKFVKGRNVNGERLVREAKVLARLNHGNLVRLCDFDQTDDGNYFIVMERAEGDNLRTLIARARKQGKGLDPQQVLHIMAQVAEGMALAHRAGVVHRDLKPENIIVAEGIDPIVRVVDFGLAKNPTGGPIALPGGIETNPANVVGTPRYMAPEQVSGGEVDARTDIFAIGVTMYEALAGRFPFERPDDEFLGETEVFARQVHAEPTPLSKYLPACSPRVSRIVLRCLAKNPADRYQSARELARDLREALANEATTHQEHEQPAAGARETAPMPPQWALGAVLPFTQSNQAPAAPAAAHVVRETLPMSPPGSTGLPQPTYAATQSPTGGRGVGYTTKMPRPSAAALAAAEDEEARKRSSASPVPLADAGTTSGVPPSGPVARDRDGSSASERARPSPASSSGIHLKPSADDQALSSSPTAIAEPQAPLDRGSEPNAMTHQQSLSGASIPQQGRAPRARILGVPPLFAAPVVGVAFASVVLAIVVLTRGPSKPAASSATATGAAAAPAPPTHEAPIGAASPATLPSVTSVADVPSPPVAPPSAAPPADAPTSAPAPSSTGSTSVPAARPTPPTPRRAPTSKPKPQPAEQLKPQQPAQTPKQEPPRAPHRDFGVDE